MRKDIKVMDAETELLAEKTAIVVIFFVALILAVLASQRFSFNVNYSPLIALSTAFLAIAAYLKNQQKNKKVEVVK